MRPAICQSGRIGESRSGITSRVRMGGSIPASHCRLVNKQKLTRKARSRWFARTSNVRRVDSFRETRRTAPPRLTRSQA